MSGASKSGEEYSTLLRFALQTGRISVDDKRKLREYKKENKITNEEHSSLLLKFGWTDEEYEDGEKTEVRLSSIGQGLKRSRKMTVWT